MENDRTGRNDQAGQKSPEPLPTERHHPRESSLGGGLLGGGLIWEPPTEGSPMDKMLKKMDKGLQHVLNKWPALGKLAVKLDKWAQSDPKQKSEQPTSNPSEKS